MFFHLVGQHWSAIPKGVHGSVFLLVSLVWAGRHSSGSISCSQFRGEQARFLAAVPPWSGPRIGCRGPKATMEADSLLEGSPWPTEVPELGRSSWVTTIWLGCRQGRLPQAWGQVGPAPCSTSWLCLAS